MQKGKCLTANYILVNTNGIVSTAQKKIKKFSLAGPVGAFRPGNNLIQVNGETVTTSNSHLSSYF
ncbi:hypothetical protein [Microcoleus sp.]|uniref:hypothetical protein n=1 Tax=Microcoleus sp. TaxID=44472 RepID=UPI0035940DB1